MQEVIRDHDLIVKAIAKSKADEAQFRAPQGVFVVAISDAEPVAGAGVRSCVGYGEIKRMWVHPQWRGAGLGSRMLRRVEEEAAKLGANGILLQGVQDQQSGSIGTGVGSSSYGGVSSTGVGVGGSFGIYNKAAHGIAIFVPQ